MSKSISSCKDCKDKCCETGPGPYKIVKPSKYLDDFGMSESYNTKCEGLTRSGKCKYWGTNKLPVECRSYVCTSRNFTKKELEVMEMVSEDYSCNNCNAKYLLINYEKGHWIHKCEICGFGRIYSSKNLKAYKSKEEVSSRC